MNRRSFAHQSTSCLAAVLAGMTTSGVAAQPANPDATPKPGQAGKDVMWLPTPDRVVEAMLRMAEVTAQDFVVDLGSGDGKIAIAAARVFGATALGLELNPELVEVSRRLAREAGVQNRVEFRQADIFESDFSSASVVTMYLLPELNLRLRPALLGMKPGTRVSSHAFGMGHWSPDETIAIGTARGLLWVVPAQVAGTWALRYPDRSDTVPRTLVLRQRFQRIEGEASLDPARVSLQNARLRGAEIAFDLRDTRGRRVQFSGSVAGDRIYGYTASGGLGRVPFEAVRVSAGPALSEADATQEEKAEAVRVLGNP